MAEVTRAGFVPTCAPGEGDPQGSRFGGRPWIPAGLDWPKCPSCGRSMHLFAQIDLATAPGAFPIAREGLLQLFYCTSSDPLCEVTLESYAPFGRGVVGRIVPVGEGALGLPDGIEPFDAQHVVDWEAIADIPHWEEPERPADLGDDAGPRDGDKWLGWPHWIQGRELPSCPDCGGEMTYLLQLDSEDHLPYMFGDSGAGHLSVCPTHPAQLSFHWACC